MVQRIEEDESGKILIPRDSVAQAQSCTVPYKSGLSELCEGKRLALAVVAVWESGDLARAVNELRKWAEKD